MQRWQYDLTTHALSELRAQLSPEVEEAPVILCSSEGRCFFHDGREPELRAMLSVLNKRGAEGWELVSLQGHDEVVHCIWKRRTEDDE